MLVLIAILLFLAAAGSVTMATVAVLVYLRLRGIDLYRLEIEIWSLWSKRQQRKPRPLGI